MGKTPAFLFYPKDWRSDPAVQGSSFATRGIWMEMLCLMWEARPRGSLSGTAEEFCRMVGCSMEEWKTFHLENERLHFANVTVHHNDVTVTNRRMAREEKRRESDRCRQSRKRSRDSHGNITSPSAVPSTPVPINPPSQNPPLPPANGFAHWPAEWTPIRERIQSTPFLARYGRWLWDLDWWKTLDEFFASCPASLDRLLLEAATYLTGEGYRPRSARAIHAKLRNCMEFAARKCEREAHANQRRVSES